MADPVRSSMSIHPGVQVSRFRFLLVALTVVFAVGCDDTFIERGGCISDDECVGARVCLDGYCTDPTAVADAGRDVGADIDTGDGGRDAADLPDDLPTPPPPRLCIETTTPVLDFGNAAPGERLSRSARLVNCGRVAVTVTELGVAAGSTDAFSVEGTPPFDIEPGGRALLVVRAASPLAGAYDGLLSVTTNAGEIEVELRLVVDAGSGTACLDFVPRNVDFGDIAAGQQRRATVTLVNCGAIDGDIDSVTVDGDRDAFDVEPVTVHLAGGERRPVTIMTRVREPDDASTYRATVRIGELGRMTATLELTFESLPAPSALCVEGPARIDLGDIDEGAPDRIERVMFSNCGTTAFVPVAAEILTGGLPTPFSLSVSPVVVDPGEAFAVAVAASTDTPGRHATFFQIRMQSGESAGLYALELNVLAAARPLLRVSPTRIDFGEVPTGSSATRVVEICNDGDADLTLRSVEIAGDADTPFVAAAIESRPLRPDECFEVNVSFPAPAPAGPEQTFAGILRVISDGGSADVALSGTAFAPDPFVCFAPLIPTVEARIDLGEETVVEAIWVNCGERPLLLEDLDVRIDGVDAFLELVEPPPGEMLEPGQELIALVSLVATAPGRHEGEIVAFVDFEAVGIPLVVHVESGPAEVCLVATPDRLVFDAVDPGEREERSVRLSNCGDVAIRIEDAIVLGRVGFALSVDDFALPRRLAPGGSLVLDIGFANPRPGSYRDTLLISTDQPDVASLEIPLSAFVVDTPVCPVLFPGAAADPAGPYHDVLEVEAGTLVWLDPGISGIGGGTIGWTADEYPGDEPTLVAVRPSGRARTTLTDVGDYVFSALYADATGCTSEGSVLVTVVPDTGVGEGLRFVVSWRTPGDPDEFEDPGSDIDMHLVRVVDGRARWNDEEDCYFANRETEWGLPGRREDNGRLLRDEVDGIGPEIIVLEEPRDDEYLLGVYYFSDVDFGPSVVTLRVFRNGLPVADATRELESTGRFWLAARILDLGREVIIVDEPNRNGFPP